jgi:hypothetical protein
MRAGASMPLKPINPHSTPASFTVGTSGMLGWRAGEEMARTRTRPPSTATEDAVIADHQLDVAGQQCAKKASASRRELRESRVAQAAANLWD